MERRLLLLVAVAGLSAQLSTAAAQATPYVPNKDMAYGDLDALISVGLVRNVMAGERPYSRAAFRRFVEEALSRAGTVVSAPRIAEALERLATRFAIGEPGGLSVTAQEARVTTAHSAFRPMRSGVKGDGIDADLNPLLQGNEGRRLADGGTASYEAAVSAWSPFIAGELTPRVSLLFPRAGGGPAGNTTLANGYGRIVLSGLAVEAGRNNLILGHGLSGGPILSQNARGLDMVRFASERPARLPGVFGVLGLWQGALAVAALGENRDNPGSALSVLRLSGRPSTFLEYGISYLNIQGGKGAPPASWEERIHDFFLFWTDGGTLEISDKVVGVDIRVLIPALRTTVNANFLTTDDRGRFTQPAGGYWEDAVWQVGGDVTGLGADGRSDFAIEWTHAGPRAHTHGQYSSGVTLDRRILGSALGPNSTGLTGRWTWTARASRTRVTGAWERYSGDDYHWALIPGGGPWDYDWFKDGDNPDEIRVRIQSEYLRYQGWRGLETSFRIGYERVTRFNFGNAGRNGVVGEVVLRYGR